jgi:undecaprenyl-diphosphatase
MSTWQALFLGVLQGATELFPVSSLGHAVLVPGLLHWTFRPSDPSFVPFLVLLHLGTAGALLVLYRRDWVRIVAGFVRAALRGRIEDDDERLAMLLMVGSIPAGVVGVLLESRIKALFGNPRAAAAFLFVNGLMLLGAELLRRRSERRAGLAGRSREEQEGSFVDASQLGFGAAALVGACQALALLPGISRSGVTIAGGLLAGLRHQEAARFSFLLATPIIGAAGLVEIPQLVSQPGPLGEYFLAALLAAVAAYLSARFLVRYFRSGRLDPYGYYCLAAGLVALALIR